MGREWEEGVGGGFWGLLSTSRESSGSGAGAASWGLVHGDQSFLLVLPPGESAWWRHHLAAGVGGRGGLIWERLTKQVARLFMSINGIGKTTVPRLFPVAVPRFGFSLKNI